MINDPPLLTIRKTWPRPQPASIAKLQGAQTGHIVDALIGRGGLDAGIKPLDPANATFAGPALTVESFADDNLAILAALAFAHKGDVLVVQAEGFRGSAVIGDNVCLMAKNAGIVGIVLDGMARDLDGILPVGLPVHCRGITPNSCVKSGPGRIGLPIVAGGVAIQSGDIVLGDRDGAVAFPQGRLTDIVAALDDIRRLEADFQARIRAGMVTPDAIRTLLASSRVSYVD
jgi:4-hydroxy-4-methyl-2-oxoglutarate aldolase